MAGKRGGGRKRAQPDPEVEQKPESEGDKFTYNQIDIRQYIREADRYAEAAKESTGQLGKLTKTTVERTGQDPWVLKIIRQLTNCDQIKKEHRLRHLFYSLNEMNMQPVPDLVDQMQAGDADGDGKPKDIGAENAEKLKGIKPLPGGDGAGTYKLQ